MARDDQTLADLHDEIDRAAGALTILHAGRLQCARGCSRCCVDEIAVFEIEAEQIRRRHAELLATGSPHPLGACAFLDSRGACRIYADRPYVCRSEGLPLRWEDADAAGGPVEMRDICPLNERPDEPITELAPESCWTLGPFEGRLAQLQVNRYGEARRIRLRGLFGE
jgi:hypothetical protein